MTSGVAFSADPVSGARDTAVVSSVYGLGDGLVSGELDADSFWVSWDGGAYESGVYFYQVNIGKDGYPGRVEIRK